MRRQTTLIALVVLVAALTACGTEKIPVENPIAQGTSTPTPSGAPRPSPTPVRSPSPTAPATPTPRPSGVVATCPYSICVDVPDASATIVSPLKVEGNASVEAGAVTIEVRQGERDSALLGSATTTATAAAPERGTFSVTVNFTPAGASGRIYAFSTRSPAQHSWIAVRF